MQYTKYRCKCKRKLYFFSVRSINIKYTKYRYALEGFYITRLEIQNVSLLRDRGLAKGSTLKILSEII